MNHIEKISLLDLALLTVPLPQMNVNGMVIWIPPINLSEASLINHQRFKIARLIAVRIDYG